MFGFITHFSHPSEFTFLQNSFSDNKEISKLNTSMDSFFKSNILIPQIKSQENKIETSGLVKFLPFFSKDFTKENENKIMSIIDEIFKDFKDRNVRIVGLGGFSSMMGDRGITLSKIHGLAVTTGNTYTAALICKSILNLTEKYNLNSKNLRVGIIGASGDIGSACFRYLRNYFNRFILIARDKINLENLFREYNNLDLVFTTDINEAIENADILISVSSSPIPLIDYNLLKEGVIFCDASFPPTVFNVTLENPRVLLYEGGKALMENSFNVNNPIWQLNFPLGVIYGCLAETIILSLEGKNENFSVGRGAIIQENIESIYSMGLRNGFKESFPKWRNFFYKEEDISRIIRVLKTKN
jgi:fatty aldehyde-generating acyl-ACP reductase